MGKEHENAADAERALAAGEPHQRVDVEPPLTEQEGVGHHHGERSAKAQRVEIVAPSLVTIQLTTTLRH
jgi:hypothetical protein